VTASVLVSLLHLLLMVLVSFLYCIDCFLYCFNDIYNFILYVLIEITLYTLTKDAYPAARVHAVVSTGT
jgi:hypothetical protein